MLMSGLMDTSVVILAAWLILSIAALAWGLRGRRVGQEPRCRKCDYDLSGIPLDRCPECGTDVDGRFRRGRRVRRKPLVILGGSGSGSSPPLRSPVRAGLSSTRSPTP